MYFKDVTGQAETKKKLIASVKRNRVSHAQLFRGLPGSGGLPLAMAFSRYLNCSDPGDDDACGKCDSCLKMNKLIHPDVHFTYPVVTKKSGSPPVSTDYIKEWRAMMLQNAYIGYPEWMEHIGAENRQGNITSAECRELIRQCHMQPFLGGYKTFIIWLPEYLRETGNVLLKVLEEPTGKAIFLLVSENSSSILTTILSRTQQVFLPKLSDEEVESGLKSRFEISEDEASRIAHVADGNFRQAVSLARAGFENDYFADFQEWARLCYAIDPHALLQKIDKIVARGREAQKNFLQYALHIIREAMLFRESEGKLNRVSENEENFTRKFSQTLNHNNLHDIVGAINTSAYEIERNANSKIVLLHLSLQMNKYLRN